MGHASAMLGSTLVTYGGFYGEDNKVLGDFVGFDLLTRLWTKVK